MVSLWIGFLLSLAVILFLSNKNLTAAMMAGGVILGAFALSFAEIFEQFLRTISDPSIILLALAMGIIPIIGAIMRAGGLIDLLVENIRLPQRYSMPSLAALMGLLPMPGGALLSAPILDKAGRGVSKEITAAVNNWFRHVFILVYPLSPALLVASQIAGLDVYRNVIYLLPGFLAALGLGYFFFLKKIDGESPSFNEQSYSRLLRPLAVIASAPVIDFSLRRLTTLENAASLIGVSTALLLGIILARDRTSLFQAARQAKPWSFALIIFGMFFYLYVFQKAEVQLILTTLPLSPLLLAITAGTLLGFSTGRVQLPATIVLPIYLTSMNHITPFAFSLIYMSTFFGYVISPVHPCLVVTCEYFDISIKAMMLRLFWPVLILTGVILLLSLTIM